MAKRTKFHENQFNTEMKNSIELHGGWAYKIPDTARFGGMKFISEKPCDIVASFRGRSYLIEGKLMTKWGSFDKSWLEKSQVKHMTSASLQGKSFCHVALNIRIPKEKINKVILFAFFPLMAGRVYSVKELKSFPGLEYRDGYWDLSTLFDCEYQLDTLENKKLTKRKRLGILKEQMED